MKMNDTLIDTFTFYIDSLKREYITGKAKEHSYRPALKSLLEALDSTIIAINEPERMKVGAPDFVIEKEQNHHLRQARIFASPPLALVEAKNIGEDLDTPENQEQLKRYLQMGNVMHTDYLQFRFYINRKLITTIYLAELRGEHIIVDSDQYHALTFAFKQLIASAAPTIRTPKSLAGYMAERAQAIRGVITKALKMDILHGADTELNNQFHAFKNQLVHDLTPEKFADLYAQTLAYGLFAARYHDQTIENFSLEEASKILPSTNPFLQKFFREIAGYEREERINWVLDSLVDVFNHCNTRQLMQGAGKEWAGKHDPIIHFYETFLDLYDPALRRKMGVYYTPLPVVKYIVNMVDKILKEEFEITDGLADSEKVELEFKSHATNKWGDRRGYSVGRKLIHRVQILDPALGTGTFLNETINKIASSSKSKYGSSWSKYVESDLLPRIYGFELMMAPYAMAHLRLNLTLSETGYKSVTGNQRLRVYLTNTLEEPHSHEDELPNFFGFQRILATESQEADIVKTTKPIMVVLGNPPYSGESSNTTAFAMNLVAAYKLEPGKNVKLQERNPKWINDDYVKFLAFAEKMIADTGEGVVAMITNHSYLDNPTFRGMRWHLMNTFTKIYVLDLHGNSKRKEAAADGSKDENIFSIQQGVSIIIAIKKKEVRDSLAEIYRGDIWGKQAIKFSYLEKNDVKWRRITPSPEKYSFTISNNNGEGKYLEGVPINELFSLNSVGIVTADDSVFVAPTTQKLLEQLNEEMDKPNSKEKIQKRLSNHDISSFYINKITYRPFDQRFIYYCPEVLERPRTKIMQHLAHKDNLALVSIRRSRESQGLWKQIFVTDNLISGATTISSLDINYAFPLYLYPEKQTEIGGHEGRVSNLNEAGISKILKHVNGYSLVKDHELKKKDDRKKVSPLDILNYIYAILHSPAYRERYNSLLKDDFARIPAAKDFAHFWTLVDLGNKLRNLHLFNVGVNEFNYSPTGNGTWKIEKIKFRPTDNNRGEVWINETQYFANIPESAWNSYIGGYQPAQKWLKERTNQELAPDEITHYQKIIKVLVDTNIIMQEIDVAWQS
jgi:predicted helicase